MTTDDLPALAADVFETVDEAEAWLNRPHPLLQNQTPQAYAELPAGDQRVIDLLISIKYGGAV